MLQYSIPGYTQTIRFDLVDTKPAQNLVMNWPHGKQEFRDRVGRMEDVLIEKEQVECPLLHTFAPGVYARQISMPKDTIVTGKIHRYAHIAIISKGSCTTVTENGTQRIEAPHIMVVPAGTKRALYIHEDMIWTTIHVTNETDLKKLEAELIVPDFEALEAEQAALQIEVKS